MNNLEQLTHYCKRAKHAHRVTTPDVAANTIAEMPHSPSHTSVSKKDGDHEQNGPDQQTLQ